MVIFYWNIAWNRTNIALAEELLSKPDVLVIIELGEGKPPYLVIGRYRIIYYKGRATLYIHKRHPITIWS